MEGASHPGGGPGLGLALMLSGGGARAAYQVGVLSEIGRQLPDLEVPLLTGVSAGGINLGFIAAHRGNFASATQALRRRWLSLTTEEVFRTDPPSLFKTGARWGLSMASGGSRLVPRGRSFVETDPLRQFLKRSIDPAAIEDNLAHTGLRAVALSALSYQTGRTVTFVQGDTPIRLAAPSVHRRTIRARLTVEHIMASAAIPLLFPAVKIGQQYYGDGSFRAAAPLGPAIQLGGDRILAISARYARSEREIRRPEVLGYPPPARILGILLNSVFLDTLDWDASTVQKINQLIDQLPEEARREEGLRRIDLYIQRPSRDIGMIAGSYEVRLPRAVRFLVRGLGTAGTRSADLLSYLLFESAYITELIELGEHDARQSWERISAFLDPESSGGEAVLQ